MPTVFDQPADGDVTHADQINQYAPAVNALERGLPFSAGSTAGTSTAYTATVFPGPADNEFGTLLVVYWHVDCGTDPTLALNGHAPLSIWKTEIAKVAAGELTAGTFSLLQCNGTKWFVLQQIGGSAGSTNASTAFSSGQVPLARGGTGADLSATGGSSQFLKQTSAGGAVSVGGILANDLPANIDCAKLANGQVSNAEFQYLDGVTSGIQSQIDGKAATSHNHAASAINSGQLALARGGTGSDLSATGGSGQYLKQNSAGGAITVSAIAAGDIASGTLAVARGGTGLGSLGTAGQALIVNAGATALEYGNPTATDSSKMPLAGGTFTGHPIQKVAEVSVTNGAGWVTIASGVLSGLLGCRFTVLLGGGYGTRSFYWDGSTLTALPDFSNSSIVVGTPATYGFGIQTSGNHIQGNCGGGYGTVAASISNISAR